MVPDVPEAPDLDAVLAEKNNTESSPNGREKNAGAMWELSEGEDVWGDVPSEEE